MKKVIAILLCIMMLPFQFGVLAAENESSLKMFFEEPFNGKADEKVTGWTFSADSNATYEYINDPENPENTVANAIRTAKGSAVELARPLGKNPVNETVVITFRGYACDTTAGLRVGIRSKIGGKSSQIVKQLQFFKGQIMDGATVLNEDNLFETKKWYDYKLVFYPTGTLDIRMNGTLIGSGVATKIPDDGFENVIFDIHRDKTGNWLIDDVCVYVDYESQLLGAAEALTFDMISNEQLISEVRNDLLLVDKVVCDGTEYPVKWESSDANLIGADGTVTQKSFTNTVKLNAKIFLPGEENVYVKKEFEITVLKRDGATDAEILAEYAELYLNEENFTDEEPDAITKNILSLPKTGAEGMTFTEWESSSPDIIGVDGSVNRPEYGNGNATVTLSSTLTLNDETIDIVLTYIVLEMPDPYEDINSTKKSLTYDVLTQEDKEAITKNLNLPKKGEGTVVVSWSAKPEGIILNDGTVVRGDKKETVTLTAEIKNGEKSDTKEFTFVVFPTAEKMLEADMAGVKIENNAVLTESFKIPLFGQEYGTEFKWESDSVYLKIDGNRAIVYRPPFESNNAEVNLTLTAVYDGVETVFNYVVTVLRDATDEQLVDEVMEVLDFSQISLEKENSVTENLALPTEIDGVNISWDAGEYGEFVKTNGEIFRPLPGKEAVMVTLSASFSRGYVDPKTKTYTFTVVPFENDSQVLERTAEALIFSALSSEDIDKVTQNLILPSKGKYDSDISWKSDSKFLEISGEDGVVTRPDWGKTSAPVKLTAEISYKGLRTEIIFDIEILEKNYMEVEQDLWSEDFEAWTSDNMFKTDNATWTRPGENEAVLSLSADPKDENNTVLKIDRTNAESGTTGYVLAGTSKAQSGIVYMGLRFYIDEGGNIRVNGRTADCDQVPVSINSSGVTATGYSLPDANVKVNDWNTLDLIIDVNNERYQVKVNGVLCEPYEESDGEQDEENSTTDGIPYNYYGQGRNATIKSFRLNFARGKVCYIDDLYMENKVLYTNAQLNLAEAWEQEFLANNDINRITDTLVFPSVWADGVRVFYYSEDSNILDTAGMIQLPSGEADVIFKVGFNDGFTEYTKAYKLHIVKDAKAELTDEEAVKADFDAVINTIKSSGMLSSLTSNLTIPTTGENGSTITAVSSDTSVLTNGGTIARGTTDKSVTLTVTVAKNGITKQEVLDITVAKKTVQSSTTSSSGGSSGGGVKVTYGEQSKGDTGIDITQPEEDTESKAVFNDLESNHWAHSELMYMVDSKIMNGTGNGNIEPERTIRREEFIKMLVVAMNLKLTEKSAGFSDVTEDAWYSTYIAAAKENGLVNGYDDGRVGIGEEISRQDMAVIIFRAAEIAESGADNLFGDDDVIADYAKSAVYTLKDIGVVNGKDNGNFAPGATATRAETACMLYRAIKKDLLK